MNLEQLRIEVGPVPLAPYVVPLDHAKLRAGVEHLSARTTRGVRRKESMPATARPNLEGQPLRVQIATVWHAYASYSGRARALMDDAVARDRQMRVARMYDQLARLGCALQKVDSLRERHARILLDHWRKSGARIATIRKNWSILRTWALALGKSGLIQPLEAYWPAAPKAPSAQPTPGGQADPGRRGRRHDHPQLIAALLRGNDQTHFFVERLGRDLRLTVEEALMFDADMARQCLAGRLVLRAPYRQEPKVVPLVTHEQALLVQQVHDYMSVRSRRRLMWSDLSLLRAVRKHENHMAYQRRKLAKGAGGESSCESGQVVPAGGGE
jgi:hypothetical protein